MRIHPRDRILELDCGEGEVSVLLAARVPEGLVVAMDPSDECVHRARVRTRDLDNVIFLSPSAGEIPWKEDFFSKALSLRFCRDLAHVLRVLAPDGLLYMLVESAPGCASPQEQVSSLEAAGFGSVEAHRLPENLAVVVGKKPVPKV